MPSFLMMKAMASMGRQRLEKVCIRQMPFKGGELSTACP